MTLEKTSLWTTPIAPSDPSSIQVKNLYIIRHGETEYNRLGIVQGRGVNSSLNAKGKEQANAFYQAYRQVPFDAVYTSSLKRSIESVESFIRDGIPHIASAGLDEIDWGNREGQEMTKERKQYYETMLHKWQQGEVDACIEGGESPTQVAARQTAPIQAILENKDHSNVLLCTHGRAIRILLCQLLEKPLRNMDLFPHDNLGLYLLSKNAQGKYQAEKFNDTQHLRQ